MCVFHSHRDRDRQTDRQTGGGETETVREARTEIFKLCIYSVQYILPQLTGISGLFFYTRKIHVSVLFYVCFLAVRTE